MKIDNFAFIKNNRGKSVQHSLESQSNRISSVVQFEGDGPVTVNAGQTLLSAALGMGIQHMHVCGGNAKCSTCRVLILQGADALSPRNEAELLLDTQMGFPQNVRLACQPTVANGQVKLKRIIKDETDIDLYVSRGGQLSSQQIGQEQELVLFFFDIRDFTPFAESHLSFDVIHIVRKLFSSFQEIIEEHNGEIIETMGDGFYAVFDCERGSAESVCSAVHSGLVHGHLNFQDW